MIMYFSFMQFMELKTDGELEQLPPRRKEIKLSIYMYVQLSTEKVFVLMGIDILMLI